MKEVYASGLAVAGLASLSQRVVWMLFVAGHFVGVGDYVIINVSV
jgi:hypothetical protein